MRRGAPGSFPRFDDATFNDARNLLMTNYALVFPGQGSQSVGMLSAFGDLAVVRDTLAEASSALNQDIGRLIAEGPLEELNLTTNTQPVMLAAGIACYRAWLATGARGGSQPGGIHGAGGRWGDQFCRCLADGALSRRCHAAGRARGRGWHGCHSGAG